MANRPRPGPGKSDRHLSLVPDVEQPPLWDSEEMSRLAYLRKLAIETGQSMEAVELIESATTAEEAVDLLGRAGLLPSEDEELDALLAWFAPLLEPGTEPLDADLCGSAFIATIRRMQPDETDLQVLLADLIGQAQVRPGPAALAMLHSLSAVGPAEIRAIAADAAAAMISAGQAGFAWAGELGSPVPGRCFSNEDVYGEQRSLALTFSYGGRQHAVILLIDYVLGGGIKDCFVTDDVHQLGAAYRGAAARDHEMRFRELDGPAARAIIEAALAAKPCPPGPDQIENVENCLDLVRARAARLPERAGARLPEAAAGADSAPPARRPQQPRTIHRLKVTLRGTKPPIWRRLEVPSDITLRQLHSVLQISFDWMDYHLHVFETPAGRYGNTEPDPDPGIRSDARRKLSAVARWPGDRIRYEYDFGDCWLHDIVVEAVEPATAGVAYPRCTAGRRASPPEDCGGTWGYYDMLAILADPAHPEHEERLEWLGLGEAGEFDPEHLDLDGVNSELSQSARVLRKQP